MTPEKCIGDYYNLATIGKLKCCMFNGKMMVSLKHFHDFLKQGHDHDSGRDYPRKFNVKKELGKHVDSVRKEGELFFNIHALLRYMFHHSNEYKVCTKTVDEVVSGLLKTETYYNPREHTDEPSITDRAGNEGFFGMVSLSSVKDDSPTIKPDLIGRQTGMKKKTKPRKITQDDIPDEDSFDFISDIVDEDCDYDFPVSFQSFNHQDENVNGNQNGLDLENGKILNGDPEDSKDLSNSVENGNYEESKDGASNSSFSSLLENAEQNENTFNRSDFEQDYQYVLETGEVPRDEYGTYDQIECVTCNLCGKRFSTPGNLKTHQRTHTGEKPYYCHFCNKRFTTKGNLDVHVRTHTGERPYKCQFCDKFFSTIGNRQVHMRTHTQERPFSCNLCNKPFSTKANLHTHMKTHSGRRDHECSFCGKAYTTLANLQTHMRSHNPFLQSFLPAESLSTSETEQSQNSSLNFGLNNLLPTPPLLGNMNLNLFNPALFLPIGMPFGMNGFIPPNFPMNNGNFTGLDLSSQDKKSEPIKSQDKPSAASGSSTNAKTESLKRPLDQADSPRPKSAKQDNSEEMPNGFVPNMALFSHMNMLNNFAFSVANQNK